MNRQNCKCVFPRILSASCTTLSYFHALTSNVMGISPLLAQGDKPKVDWQDFSEQTVQRSVHEGGHLSQVESPLWR
jgi:hypothetical protein